MCLYLMDLSDSDNNPRVVQVPYEQATGIEPAQAAKAERVKVRTNVALVRRERKGAGA